MSMPSAGTTYYVISDREYAPLPISILESAREISKLLARDGHSVQIMEVTVMHSIVGVYGGGVEMG
jgi:hypothetical protein